MPKPAALRRGERLLPVKRVAGIELDGLAAFDGEPPLRKQTAVEGPDALTGSQEADHHLKLAEREQRLGERAVGAIGAELR